MATNNRWWVVVARGDWGGRLRALASGIVASAIGGRFDWPTALRIAFGLVLWFALLVLRAAARGRVRWWWYRRWHRSRLYRATLYNLPLGRYRCYTCHKLITDRTCDRNLIADWAFCDRCLAALLRSLPEGEQ